MFLPYSAVAGRNVNWISGALYPDGTGFPFPGPEENIYAGGVITSTEADLIARRTGGPCAVAGCLNNYFAEAQQCYNTFQATISANTVNVQSTIAFDALIITCNSATDLIYYTTLTSTQLGQFTYTVLDNCNFQAEWFITITGNDNVEITGASFPAIPGGIVYNVLGSGRQIYVHDTQLGGHLLAPNNILNQPNGVIVGKVVVGDVTTSHQVNKQNNCPNPSSVTVNAIVGGVDGNSATIQGNLQPGDTVTDGGNKRDATGSYTVVSVNGNSIILDRAPQGWSQGTHITALVDSQSGRPIQSVKSSASVVSFAVVVIVALIALAF